MLVIIRSSVLCNLRRIAACVSYRNKMRMKIVRQCNEPKLLSISSPNIAACRIYSTEPDSKPRILPMLVTGASAFIPSPLIPFHFFFVSFMTIPHIDKEFLIPETLDGAKYVWDFLDDLEMYYIYYLDIDKYILNFLGNNSNIQSFSEWRLRFLRRSCSRRYDRRIKNKDQDP